MKRKPAAPPAPPVSAEPEFVPPQPPPADGGPVLSFREVPKFPTAHYQINVAWGDLEWHLARHTAPDYGLDLDPPWQRAHVWTPEQRVRYIEHVLKGGEVGRNVTIVCREWGLTYPVPGYALLDGKQRIETVRAFLRGEVRVFPDAARPEGYAIQDFKGAARGLSFEYDFLWRVVICKTPADVIALYLAINAGGTPHTAEELERVRQMHAEELRTALDNAG
jgi:hypothetical protein